MNSEQKNIDRIFRERLRNFDAEPPVDVWDTIRENLNLERRRKNIFWITRIAAGIAILTVLSLTYFIARNSIREGQISGNKGAKTEEKLSGEKLAAGESTESKIADKVSSKEEVKGTQKEQIIENPKTEKELKIAHTTFEKVEEEDNITGSTSENIFAAKIIRKSINQLDYNYPGNELMTSSLELHGRPSGEDVKAEENLPGNMYSLNIPEEQKTLENRWAVGTEISPLYSYRNLETQNEAMDLANNLNQTESGTLAYSGGVNVNYSLLKRLSLQSGVYYSRYGVNVDNAYVFKYEAADAASNNRFYSISYSSGRIDIEENGMVDYVTNKGDRKQYYTGTALDSYTPEANRGEIVQNFEYLELPLILRYKVIDRKIGFNLLGGLSTNLLVGSNTYYSSGGDREKIGKTTDIKPFNYSSIVGLGLDYSISKHLNICLEPTFRYYLNSINQSSIIRSYPYSIGVFTGMRYSF